MFNFITEKEIILGKLVRLEDKLSESKNKLDQYSKELNFTISNIKYFEDFDEDGEFLYELINSNPISLEKLKGFSKFNKIINERNNTLTICLNKKANIKESNFYKLVPISISEEDMIRNTLLLHNSENEETEFIEKIRNAINAKENDLSLSLKISKAIKGKVFKESLIFGESYDIKTISDVFRKYIEGKIEVKNSISRPELNYHEFLIHKQTSLKEMLDNIAKEISDYERHISHGHWLINKFDSFDYEINRIEIYDDYRPYDRNATKFVPKLARREPFLLLIKTLKLPKPIFADEEVIHVNYDNKINCISYLENKNVQINKNFWITIYFLIQHFEINNYKLNELDDFYFPKKTELNLHDYLTIDSRSSELSWEFALNILEYNLKQNYFGNIQDCSFRLRILINYILSFQ
jgi:hypothetical protein